MAGEWQGDNPFHLVIQTTEGDHKIDLDETGWLTTYAPLLRETGAWMLIHKASLQAVVIILVQPGEQPYYTARHVGIAFGGSGEMIAYGIGKKRADGHVDRLWVLPNGVVCAGDDVEPILLAFLRAGPVNEQEETMGEMTTGSMGGNAHEVNDVKTDKPGEGATSIPDAAEQTEKQAVSVDGPTEATSADTELEGKKS